METISSSYDTQTHTRVTNTPNLIFIKREADKVAIRRGERGGNLNRVHIPLALLFEMTRDHD